LVIDVIFKEISPILDLDSEKILYHVESKMPMLAAIVKESMRLFPLGAAFSRIPTRDVEIGGFKILEGSKILVSPFVLQRMEAFWGKSVNDFDPTRFLRKDFQQGKHFQM
jgi:cytochrome P450